MEKINIFLRHTGIEHTSLRPRVGTSLLSLVGNTMGITEYSSRKQTGEAGVRLIGTFMTNEMSF